MSQIAAADPVLELPGSSLDQSNPKARASAGERHTTALWWLVLAVVWVICALYAFHYLRRGWVPHDEGTLGQSAERILHGQLPHRDFDEIYSGGLSFLNAATFSVLGTNLFSLRLVLYAVFLAWIPAVYYIASRFVTPIGAGAAALLAAAWSLPNYSAAMPSWYNLFLATFGIAAVFRYIDDKQARWLVLAGICGGLSCIIKIIGVYYIGAVLLFLVYRAQLLAKSADGEAARRTWWYSIFVNVSLALFIVATSALIRAQPGLREIVNFLVPILALGAFIMWSEWRAGSRLGDLERFRMLARMMLPLLLGVAIPIAIFLVPYVRSEAIGALIEGVFVTPTKRFGAATMRLPHIDNLLVAVILLPLSGIVPVGRNGPSRITRLVVGIGLAAALVLAGRNAWVYQYTWGTMRGMIPLAILLGLSLLASRENQLPADQRQRLFLLLAACGLCALVQYPFAAPVYFFYVAPIAVLAGVAVLASWPRLGKLGPGAIVTFYIAFAVLRIHPGFIYQMGVYFSPYDSNERLALPRGGLDVPEDDAVVFQRIVLLLKQHANGAFTYATPDAPEIYFLSGLSNPTRTLFDFFDDPDGREQRILAALSKHHVNAVVINSNPGFSKVVSSTLGKELASMYPDSARLGNFTIRWRQ